MKKSLKDLLPLEKLSMAVECIEQSVPFPSVIVDFLVEHGLYEIVNKHRIHNGKPNSKDST